MHKAGIDPEYLADSFKKLQAYHEARKKESDKSDSKESPVQEGMVQAPGEDDSQVEEKSSEEEKAFDLEKTLENWMSSHPDIAERIASVREHSKRLGPIDKAHSFDLDWSVTDRLKSDKPNTEEASQ